MNNKIYIFAENQLKFEECCKVNAIFTREAIFVSKKIHFSLMNPKLDRILFYGLWNTNKFYAEKKIEPRVTYLLYIGNMRQIDG